MPAPPPRMTKDSREVLDYGFDWTRWLAPDETIDDAEWAVSPANTGLVVDSTSRTATHTFVWLSGGTPGKVATIECRLTTSSGRRPERAIVLEIVDRR